MAVNPRRVRPASSLAALPDGSLRPRRGLAEVTAATYPTAEDQRSENRATTASWWWHSRATSAPDLRDRGELVLAAGAVGPRGRGEPVVPARMIVVSQRCCRSPAPLSPSSAAPGRRSAGALRSSAVTAATAAIGESLYCAGRAEVAGDLQLAHPAATSPCSSWSTVRPPRSSLQGRGCRDREQLLATRNVGAVEAPTIASDAKGMVALCIVSWRRSITVVAAHGCGRVDLERLPQVSPVHCWSRGWLFRISVVR